jgi:signal transduction histidine kinase
VRRAAAWVRARAVVIDLALIAFFLLLGVPSASVDSPLGWLRIGVVAGLVGPLLLRRRHPAATMAVVAVTVVVEMVVKPWGQFVPSMNLSLAVLLYTVVVYGRRSQVQPAVAVCAALVGWWAVTMFSTATPEGTRAAVMALSCVVVVFLASWMLGEFVAARRTCLAEVEDRAERAEVEQRALARAAVAEERTRIAREMHDVVAHAVSMMVMQAEGARIALPAGQVDVEQVLRDIGRSGRDAMGELRRMLDLLRSEPTGTVPQPTGADLAATVESMRAVGLAVELEQVNVPKGVPAGLAVQLVRIAQEALTNVVKHAPPPATAHVLADWGEPGPARQVLLRISNTAGTVVARPLAYLPSGGHGLDGMQERVAMYGGSLCTRLTPDGGFLVEAVLPVGTPHDGRYDEEATHWYDHRTRADL